MYKKPTQHLLKTLTYTKPYPRLFSLHYHSNTKNDLITNTSAGITTNANVNSFTGSNITATNYAHTGIQTFTTPNTDTFATSNTNINAFTDANANVLNENTLQNPLYPIHPVEYTPPNENLDPFIAPSSIPYLKTITNFRLFSLSIIGLLTLHKSILNLVIKLFPIMPIQLIKWFISPLYCGGTNFEEVKSCLENLNKRGISNIMLSLTIENSNNIKLVNDQTQLIIDQTLQSIDYVLKPAILDKLSKIDPTASNYEQLINEIPPGYIALKPSAMIKDSNDILLNFNNPDYQLERNQLIENCSLVCQKCHDLNLQLLEKFPQRKTPFFVTTIDAEKFELQKKGVTFLQRILFEKFNSDKLPFITVVGTFQLYLKDSQKAIEREYTLAKQNNYKLGLKIVRGAYLHSEENAQDIIFNSKFKTDENYNSIMIQIIKDLLENKENSIYNHLVIASHNYKSTLLANNLIQLQKNENGNIFANFNIIIGTLLGMADNLSHDLIENHNAKNLIKYVPWGPPKETKDYLLRRLQENGDTVRNDNGIQLLKDIYKTIF
ncbi:hypothetical protein TBLA_0H01140 [Henningerozyma blattae CBS 6284]|uniref:Proline dehydrogenase n=1 Tax=Henningerozyma blattae (strain ATCC 34711 / CBS 6284 / DSM 70876 / NBRC 10599 / NRRL Y-10934 / UCD 77-7) TaxID=1071380 RepID=I2H7Q0_HENB6|nr:hypothetical protein TBLA_0H01140 [Tetrapisispora blattae CBS 6284]CCH62402.1 hypothetical protein TBLA_0H01140 [Tetrapisispora blattae CBS 6284]